MKLAPIHVRTVTTGIGHQDGTTQRDYLYVFGKYRDKYDDYPDLLTLFADVYGVPSSFDEVGTEEMEYDPPAFITEDHLEYSTVLSPEHFPGEIHMDQVQRSLNHAITRHLMEAAKMVNVSNDEIKNNVRVADDNNISGAYRIYAVENKKLQVHAKFSVYIAFENDTLAVNSTLSEVEVVDGLFGRGGL